MRLHVMSDIHFEHMYEDDGDIFWKQLEKLRSKDPAKLLVLAGDICQIGHRESLWRARVAQLCGYYEKVVYVTGNHEHYSSSFPEVAAFLDAIDGAPNFTNLIQLRHGPFVYSDGTETRRFIGDTMWFPDTDQSSYTKQCMADFHTITQFEPTVYVEHAEFLSSVIDNIKAGDIVVTHHLPLQSCVDAQYEGSPLNPFFVADMAGNLDEKCLPRLWIHGHTHTAVDLIHTVGAEKMRVYCNPHAYPNEGSNQPFWDRVAIDV